MHVSLLRQNNQCMEIKFSLQQLKKLCKVATKNIFWRNLKTIRVKLGDGEVINLDNRLINHQTHVISKNTDAAKVLNGANQFKSCLV